MTQERGPDLAQEKALTPVPDKEARSWAMLCHLAALAGLVCPFGNVIGPLILWALKHEDSPLVDQQGREAINFQLTIALAIMISMPLVFILIGIPLIIMLAAFDLVLIVVAAVKVNDGENYRYPCTLRFFR